MPVILSDIVLLILPLLNTGLYIFTALVMLAEWSNLKKNALRAVMIFGSVTIPFLIVYLITNTDELLSVYEDELLQRSKRMIVFVLVCVSLASLITALRLHIFAGKEHAPVRASGQIHTWKFKYFFRENWRWLYYADVLVLAVVVFYLLQFYGEFYDLIHNGFRAL